MRTQHPAGRYLFFDLSETSEAGTSAFFEQASQHLQAPELEGPITWLLTLRQYLDFANGPSTKFSGLWQQRLAAGDRIFVTPAGSPDWNTLFFDEAQKELAQLALPSEVGLWLKNTAGIPAWCREQAVIATSDEGLHWGSSDRRWVLPWAKDGRDGAIWVVPGQVLVGDWPSGRFLTLPQNHGLRPQDQALTPLQKFKQLEIASQRSKHEPGRRASLRENTQYPGLGFRDALDFEQTLGGVRKRSLIANMQGTSDLREDPLRVIFQGGRLKKILWNEQKTPLITSTESYLVWGHRKHAFRTINAFSFEGDFSWGLRETAILESPDLSSPGRMVTDSFFVEESNEFFVSVTVKWPRWHQPTTIESRAVLELKAFCWPRSTALTVRSVDADGTARDEMAGRHPETNATSGVEFHFSAGSTALVLGFPQNQAPRPHTLSWKTISKTGSHQLVVNPEGSWQPISSDHLGGWEEHFTFFLTLPGGPLPYAVTRKVATELIPPYVNLDTAHDPA